MAIHLLDKSRQGLISEDQLLVFADKVVRKYSSSGIIPSKEFDDVKMAIVEKYLKKQDKISKAYSGDAKISTYCIAVLNRMCCEVIRKELKHWKNQCEEQLEGESTSDFSASAQLLIQDEVQLLRRILIFFNDEYSKIVFCLAFLYQLPLKKDVVLAYDSKGVAVIKNTDIREQVKNKGDIYKELAILVNVVEDRKLKPDAIRMWVNKTVDKIVCRLNGPFQRASYDKESFQILFEYFYEDKK